eukprot:363595-Chlamydomonas_euryale.AAC.4
MHAVSCVERGKTRMSSPVLRGRIRDMHAYRHRRVHACKPPCLPFLCEDVMERQGVKAGAAGRICAFPRCASAHQPSGWPTSMRACIARCVPA